MNPKPLQIMQGGRIPFEAGGVAEIELVQHLGGGGFGSAWRVIDTATGRDYTLKIIQNVKTSSVDPERVRLEAEVAIASDFIIPVVGLRVWDENTHLILFEYFKGRSLDRLLRPGDLTEQERCSIFNQILFGTADAHQSNIIHRDLKPANVLVSEDLQVKLIDFGISKFKDIELTGDGQIFGTLPYMAPELFVRGSKYADATTDIYALGQIFYELIVGHNLWHERGWRKLPEFFSFLRADPPPKEVMDLEKFKCRSYPAAESVLLRMVKISPDERPASVDEILVELGVSSEFETLPVVDYGFPVLIVESGSNRNARTFVSLDTGGSIILGRADIAGNDESISRKHIEITRIENRYFLCDLDSKNGTMVSGHLLAPQKKRELFHADRIKVGDVFMRFALMNKAAAEAASGPKGKREDL